MYIENAMVLYTETIPRRRRTKTLYRWEDKWVTGSYLKYYLETAPLEDIARMGATDEQTAERVSLECTDAEELAWFFNIDSMEVEA